jgi:hypothetical protein
MMMHMAEPENPARYDCRHLDTIRAKFREVFGRECTLRDEMVLRRYTITAEGDLVMFVQ